MQITKTDTEIIDYTETKNFYLTIENDKGEKIDIIYQRYISNTPQGGYDNEDNYYDKDGNELITDYLEDFLGDDYDDFYDQLQDLK